MAILEGAPGFKVIVCSGEKELEEYPDDGEWTIKNYVVPPQEF